MAGAAAVCPHVCLSVPVPLSVSASVVLDVLVSLCFPYPDSPCVSLILSVFVKSTCFLWNQRSLIGGFSFQ